MHPQCITERPVDSALKRAESPSGAIDEGDAALIAAEVRRLGWENEQASAVIGLLKKDRSLLAVEVERLRELLKKQDARIERLANERNKRMAKLARVEALPDQFDKREQKLADSRMEFTADDASNLLRDALSDPQPSAAPTSCEHAWISYSRPPMRAVTGRRCTKCALIEEKPKKREPYNGW